MELKEKLQDYTRAEFVALVEKIKAVDGSKENHDGLIRHFDQVVIHPRGADLLFYPNADEADFGYDDVGTIFHHVKKWHNDRGQLAFKDHTLPQPRQRPSGSTPQPSAKDRAWNASSDNLAKIQKVAGQIEEARRNVENAFTSLEALLNATENEQKAQTFESTNRMNVALLEERLSKLEAAQRAVTRGVYGYNFLDLTVKFARDDAQRSISYSHLDKELQASILQQMIQISEQYLALKPNLATRELEIHIRTQALLDEVEAQLIRLATVTGAGPLKEDNFFSASVSDIDAIPQVLTTYSDISNAFDSVLPGLRHIIRSATSGLAWGIAPEGAELAVQHAAVMAFQFDRPGCGEPFALSVPLSDLMPTEGRDWSYLGAINAEVDMAFRMRSDIAKMRHGKLRQGLREVNELAHIYVVSTNTSTVASKVKVHTAVWDAVSNGYRFTRSGLPANDVLWSTQSPLTLTSSDLPGRKRLSGPGYIGSVSVPVVEAIPVVEDLYFDDCIVVFPENSGVEPVYVMFKAAREYAGAATGNGQSVEGNWLQRGMHGGGADIPSQIADRLRGRVFKRFSLFRESFWKTVADDSTLSSQFSVDDVAVMKEGRGPLVLRRATSLQPDRLEIFHVSSPENGGNVYDMDNMRIGVRHKADVGFS